VLGYYTTPALQLFLGQALRKLRKRVAFRPQGRNDG